MKELKINSILLLKIFLPALSCVLSVYFFSVTLKDYTNATLLFFGLIIILFNYRKTKYNYYISFIISIVLSYLTFFLALGIHAGISYLLIQFIDFDKLENLNMFTHFITKLFSLFSISLLSPILMFRSYRILFKIKYDKYYKSVQFIVIILLIVYGLISKELEKEYFIVWQFLMVLSLQLILYQEEIKLLFINKK